MKTINHECYVDLEVAKLLKEAGFDWEVQSYYSKLSRKQGRLLWLPCGCRYKENINTNQNRYSAPTLDVAQRWLREVKDWEAQVAYGFNENGHKTYVTECGNPKGDLENYIVYFSTYEQAQEAGIKKALEIILEKGE